jgi:hypothetical protein
MKRLTERGALWLAFALSCLSMALVVGCAQLGVPSPQTMSEKVAVAISTVTAVRQTATTLLAAKKISVEDAQNVQAQADTARAGVEVARQMAATDPAGAATKLQTATTILTALQAYLTAKETPK